MQYRELQKLCTQHKHELGISRCSGKGVTKEKLAKLLVEFAKPTVKQNVEPLQKTHKREPFQFYNLKNGGYYEKSSFPSKVEKRCQDALEQRKSTELEYMRGDDRVILKMKFEVGVGGVFLIKTIKKNDPERAIVGSFYAIRPTKPGQSSNNIKFIVKDGPYRRQVNVPPDTYEKMRLSFALRRKLEEPYVVNGVSTKVIMSYSGVSYSGRIEANNKKSQFFAFEVIPTM